MVVFRNLGATMKVCILSDSHDHRDLLSRAVAAAKRQGAEAVLHCGDVVAPSTLSVVEPHGLPFHVIHGNNTGDLYALSRRSARKDSVVEYHGQDASLTLGGRRIFLVHYPHYAKGMASTGDWDLVCCGHTHKVDAQTVPNVNGGETLVLNPGSVGGVDTDRATFVMMDLDDLSYEIFEVPELPGK